MCMRNFGPPEWRRVENGHAREAHARQPRQGPRRFGGLVQLVVPREFTTVRQNLPNREIRRISLLLTVPKNSQDRHFLKALARFDGAGKFAGLFSSYCKWAKSTVSQNFRHRHFPQNPGGSHGVEKFSTPCFAALPNRHSFKFRGSRDGLGKFPTPFSIPLTVLENFRDHHFHFEIS